MSRNSTSDRSYVEKHDDHATGWVAPFTETGGTEDANGPGMRTWLLIFCMLPVSVAVAEPSDSSSSAREPTGSYGVGFRVGGYGFKREGDLRPGLGWTECRMNGIGIFAERAIRGPIYVEAGLDMYSSADFPIGGEATDLPIDRTSGLASLAVGARTRLASRITGHVQLGAGVELTRVSVPYGDDRVIRDTKVLPEAFFGTGLDVRVGARTHLGMTLRALAMGNFNYDPKQLEMGNAWVSPQPEMVFDASLDFAFQGQFYVRRQL